MADIEDEDEYLYGSDNDVKEPSAKRQKTSVAEVTKDAKNEPKPTPGDENSQDGGEGEDDDEDGSDSDSDSDIEFVIGDGASADTAAATAAAPTTTTTITTNTEDLGGEKKTTDTTTIVSKDQEGSGSGSSLDVNGVATLDGKPLTQIDLELLANKPWRMPGADISDYFNYGFDEITWTAYCCKQDKLRGEFNPQKIMSQLMGGQNMPMMPGMPPMMMPPMPPGMQMPPNFMNPRK